MFGIMRCFKVGCSFFAEVKKALSVPWLVHIPSLIKPFSLLHMDFHKETASPVRIKETPKLRSNDVRYSLVHD